jgi:hypothetical protein
MVKENKERQPASSDVSIQRRERCSGRVDGNAENDFGDH